MRALIYIRVSTSKQEEGYSIPLQKERLIAYCKAKGWVVAGMFVDPGHSGASLERPGMASLIEAVNAGKGDVVLVYKMDRLSRSQRDMLHVLEDIFDAQGVAFVSMMESFDTSNIYGKAMLGILSVFSQMEREVITERTMLGRTGRAEQGKWHGGGTSPIGYDYIEGELKINQSEAEQVRMVYALYADGYSVAEISRRMEGCFTKYGDWSHTSTVGNVLDNPLYAGTVHFDGAKAAGKHTPIIDKTLDQAVKARRARMQKVEAARESSFLLTGLIYCDSCGARYFPNRRPNGSIVYSCHSRAKKNKKMIKSPNCKAPHYPIIELDTMVEEELLELAKKPLKVKKRAAGEGDSIKVSREIQRLTDEINALMDLLTHDHSTAAVGDIADKISKLHAERMSIQPEPLQQNYDVAMAKKLLREVNGSWADLDLRGRRALLYQLIDGIYISAEGIRFEWPFEGKSSYNSRL